jgi:MFS transporter, AAHS family, benzoate transport protein
MRQVDVRKSSNEVKFNVFHAVVLTYCALIIVFDGHWTGLSRA